MDLGNLAIWILALVLGGLAYSRPGKLHRQGLKISWDNALSIFPRIIIATLMSGFFSVLIPTDLVATWLGRESGIRGILIGSLVGGFTPGGPIICFPIVMIFYKTGAGIPPLIAFLTAWSIFGFHRIMAYEIPFMGSRFVLLRMIASLPLPPLTGLLAALIEANYPLGF